MMLCLCGVECTQVPSETHGDFRVSSANYAEADLVGKTELPRCSELMAVVYHTGSPNSP
jgi:hypothetical protein